METQRPSYLAEFLRTEHNVIALLGGLALSALASLPFGLEGALIPLIATVSLEAIACLFVPDISTFRRWSDDRWREDQRETQAMQLRAEIGKRAGSVDVFAQCMEDYGRVTQRVDSLSQVARERSGQLSIEDIERIKDVQNEFLGLQLTLKVIDERTKAVNLPDVVRKLERIKRDIENPVVGADMRQLVRAQQEYEALIARHQRMMSRRVAIEAAITALPDQLDEIFQMVMTATAGDSSEVRLTDAISRLRLQEDMEEELNKELSSEIPQLRPLHAIHTSSAAAAQQIKVG